MSIDKVKAKVKARREAVESKIKQAQANLKTNTQLDTRRCNTLIAHYIAAEIENSKTQRYGQILRNLGVIQEIRNGDEPIYWVNEYDLPSQDLLDRLGGVKEVQKTVSKHLIKHSGLRKSETLPSTLTRYDYNKMINTLVMMAIQRYPSWSFSKILRNLEILRENLFSDIKNRNWINEFNTEPSAILARARKYEDLVREGK